MPFERELEEALRAARSASDLILKDYDALVAIPNAPADISTKTDRGAQEIILRHLLAYFPNDGLCAEEATRTLEDMRPTSQRTWIVDPIDGTRGFAMKNGEFCVMIGLVEQGELAVGVVLEPVQQRLTYATRGGGCWLQMGMDAPRRCCVSGATSLSGSTLVKSHGKSHHGESGPVGAIGPARIIETYSAGVKLGLVARGDADLYVNNYANFHDWDICAGHLLVVEAGGKATTLAGDPIRYGAAGGIQSGGLLASNGALHEAAVAALSLADGR